MIARWLYVLWFFAAVSVANFCVADELVFGNQIENVHPDEVELVKFLRKVGISYNLTTSLKNGQVTNLYMQIDKPLTIEQMQPLLKATQLKHVSCPVWADDAFLEFFTAPNRFPLLEFIQISASKITDKGLAGLRNLPKLEAINLTSNLITDEGVQYISQAPRIGLLRLHARQVTDRGMFYLNDLKMLRHLELNGTQITDEAMKYLGNIVTLNTLYLDETQVTGSTLGKLARLSALNHLSFNRTRLNDNGLAQLAEYPNLAKIGVLYAEDTKITDAGCVAFRTLKNLLVLNLGRTEITDEGIKHLQDMPRLYNLVLSDKVTDRGRQWLADHANFAGGMQRSFATKQPEPAVSGKQPIRPMSEAQQAMLEVQKQREARRQQLQDIVSKGTNVVYAGVWVLQPNAVTLPKTQMDSVYRDMKNTDEQIAALAMQAVVVMKEDTSAKCAALSSVLLSSKAQSTSQAIALDTLFRFANQLTANDDELTIVVDALANVMKKVDDPQTAAACARQLGQLGGKAKSAKATLSSFADVDSSELSTAARRALAQIEACPLTQMEKSGVPLDVRASVHALFSDDSALVEAAQARLKRSGPSVIPALIIAANDQRNSLYPNNAGTVLASFAKDDVLEALSPQFRSESPNVRIMCLYWAMMVPWDRLPTFVAESLESLDVNVRTRARLWIPHIAKKCSGEAAQQVAIMLVAELKRPSTDWMLPSSQFGALEQIVKDPNELSGYLVEILRTDTAYAAAYACRSMRFLQLATDTPLTDRTRQNMFEALVAALDASEHDDTKVACLRALPSFSAQAPSTLVKLRELEASPRSPSVSKRSRATSNSSQAQLQLQLQLNSNSSSNSYSYSYSYSYSRHKKSPQYKTAGFLSSSFSQPSLSPCRSRRASDHLCRPCQPWAFRRSARRWSATGWRRWLHWTARCGSPWSGRSRRL